MSTKRGSKAPKKGGSAAEAKRAAQRSPSTKRAKKTTAKSTRKSAAIPSRARPPIAFDWSGIATSSDAHRFEELALELFAEHYGEEQFIPNARRPGRDGGVDGLFSGTINRVRGPWKIACAVRSKLPAVKNKVRDENALARKAGQRALFFITSYDGTAPDVAQLERLAGRGLRGAKVWCRRQLERVLRDRPLLRQTYFGHQVVPGFVPADFSMALDDQSQPDIELVGRAVEAEQLRDAIAGKPRIIVVAAAGGAGKTRLIRALPTLMKGIRPTRTAWLRRPEQGSIEAALQSGLPARRPLLLILDDAAQALSEVDQLKRLATDRSPGMDVKVVLAIRAVDRGVLESRIGGARDAVRWMELRELSEADGARIARMECPRLSDENANKLARAFGSNLFLLRAAAQLVEKGDSPARVVDDTFLRRIVAQRFIDEAARHLQFLGDAGAAAMRLALLALDVPIPFADASEDLAISSLHLAGLLRRVGDTLRFRRDVEGDVLLAHLIERPAERASLQRHVFGALERNDLPRRIRNLGAAGRGQAAALIREVVARWRGDPELAGSRHRMLDMLPHCAASAPAEVAALCIHAATSVELDSDATGPIVLALAAEDLATALNLAGALEDLGVVPGTYSNYQAQGMARTLLNPLFRGRSAMHDACAVLDAWLDAAALGRRVQLLAAAVEALFATVVRWDVNDGVSLRVREVQLAATPAVLQLRRAALALWSKMLRHPDREVRASAVSVLERHGGPGLGRVSTSALDAAAAEELESLADVLRLRLEGETDIPILAQLHIALATHWAAVRPGADTAAQLLRGRKADPLVKAYHYASPATAWFYDFDEVRARAPGEDASRWPWWVNTFLFARRDPAEVDRLVGDLHARYPAAGDVVRCVATLASSANASSVLDAWCRRAPAVFELALATAAATPDRDTLSRVLRRHRYRNDPAALLRELQQLPSTADASVMRSMLSDEAWRTADAALELARHFAAAEDVEVRRMALDVVGHRDDASAEHVMGIIEEILRDGDWSDHWQGIWHAIHPTARSELVAERPRLRERLEQQLLGAGCTGDDWHEQRVLELLFAVDDARRLAFLRRVRDLDLAEAAYRIGRLAKPLFSEIDRFRLLAAELVRWVGELGVEGGRVVADVMDTAIVDTRLPEGAFEVAREMLDETSDEARRVGLLLLGQMQDSPPACALLADVSIGPDESLRKLAESQLRAFDVPKRGWSRTIGQPAPELVALRHTVATAMSLASKAARPRLAAVANDIDERIAADSRTDEELLASD